MKNLKHLNKIVKTITPKKINQNLNENPIEINWTTPRKKRYVKTSWKINIKKNK